MSNKIQLILPILFLSCSFVTDSEDSESTITPLVGTWNLTTILYFDNSTCSGVASDTLDVNEDLADFGLDVYQAQITVTIDSYIIILGSISYKPGEWEEDALTGRMVVHGGQYCVIWDTVEDRDDCYECKNYTLNGDELDVYMTDCTPGALPSPTGEIGLCQILTLEKQQ